MNFGWRGRYLVVNLTNGTIESEPLEKDVLRGSIGGIGLAAYLVSQYGSPKCDPLGDDNILAHLSLILVWCIEVGSLGVGRCLHDRDLAPSARSVAAFYARFVAVHNFPC